MKTPSVVGREFLNGLKLIACASLMLLASCSSGNDPEEGEFTSRGTITGMDPRFCMCCGGWFITIDAVQYRFDELPPGSTLDLRTETLPLNVRLDWKKRKNACMGDEIDVQRIEKE